MIDAIIDFLGSVFGAYPWLTTILLSIVPMIELRGALPLALSGTIWGSVAVLSWWQGYLLCVFGSTLPALIIIPLLKPFFNYLRKTKFKKVVDKLDKKFKKHTAEITKDVDQCAEQKKKDRIKFWGVATFVSVPLPLTGAYTGAAIAAYLNMSFWKGVLSIFLGNVVCGSIMLLLCTIFKGFEDIIFYVLLFVVLIFVMYSGILYLIKKLKRRKKAKELKSIRNLKQASLERNENNKDIDVKINLAIANADENGIETKKNNNNSKKYKDKLENNSK